MVIEKRAALRIETDCLRPGMILAQPVQDRATGSVLLEAGTTLNPGQISVLKRRGIHAVAVFGTDEAKSAVSAARENQVAATLAEDITGVDLDGMLATAREVLKEFQEENRQEYQLASGHHHDLRALLRRGFIELLGDETRQLDSRPARELIGSILTALAAQKNHYLYLVQLYANRESDLFTHATNVCLLALVVGEALGLDRETRVELGVSALYHDIGMVFVPAEVILKPVSELTLGERLELKSHPERGYEVLRRGLKFSAAMAEATRQHHERHDGSGYPNGLSGKNIGAFAQVIGVVNAYEMLISPLRCHQPCLPYAAMKLLLGMAGKEYDRDVVKGLLDHLAIYPVGSLVKMNTGSVALVLQSNPRAPLRPVIKPLFATGGAPLYKAVPVDLLNDRTMFITEIVSQILGEEDIARL